MWSVFSRELFFMPYVPVLKGKRSTLKIGGLIPITHIIPIFEKKKKKTWSSASKIITRNNNGTEDVVHCG